MNQQSVSVEKGTFKSPILPITAIFFAIAAIFGSLSLGYLFHPSSIPAVIKDLAQGGIYEPDAQKTWTIIYIIATVLNFLATLVLTCGISLILFRQQHLGVNLLSYSVKFTLYGLNISGVALVLLFIYKAVRYIITCCQGNSNDAIFLIISLIGMEGLMFTLVCILFFKLRQFLESLMESTASISYTLYTGKIDSPSIPPRSILGFLIFGLIDIVIVLDRFFTFSYGLENNQVAYYLPLTTDPIQIISGLSFFFAGIGSITLYFYLKNYKRKCEILLFRSVKVVTG